MIRYIVLSGAGQYEITEGDKKEAARGLETAKELLEEMFRVFASKVSSRGELGELSSLNQRVWGEYLLLAGFLETLKL